jgi:hypothetical protein
MEKYMNNKERIDADVIVVGGGAAGLMAAGRAGEQGARVLLLEKTGSLGKKLLVSGKTRCNLTNAAELKAFLAMYGPNGRFLYGAFSRFFRPELIAFFERFGVAAKIERGGRIFPVSDNARDIVCAFQKYLTEHNVCIQFGTGVQSLRQDEASCFVAQTAHRRYRSPALIIATGGSSWPGTGSTGDGYMLSAALGHTISELRPALVPLIVHEQAFAKSMQGVSLRNVRATAFLGRAESIEAGLTPACDYGRGESKIPRLPVIESRFGEMLFTHFGLGGPIILLMSLAVVTALKNGPVSILIDLKPALTKEQLRKRLIADFNHFGKRKIASILKDYLPAKMIDPLIGLSGIDEAKPAHQISADERDSIIDLLKALRFNVKAPLPLAKAIVTAGGVALAEIDPRTMSSKKIPGLYFGGEVMDIDADTGGYNLQAAFSTGYVAGESAAHYVKHLKAPGAKT